MYTKQHASQLRHQFWTRVGQYMAPVPSAEGKKINWINYKTDQKHIDIKLNADQHAAIIGLEISHPLAAEQQKMMQVLQMHRSKLPLVPGSRWEWRLPEKNTYNNKVPGIFASLLPINMFDEADWPTLISFFKTHLLALDVFWSNARYALEMMEE